MNTLALLKAWGRWQRNELTHLGYNRVKLGNSHYVAEWASEDDLMFVDDVLAQLKKQDEMLFNVIKWRFAYAETYKQIVTRLKRKSPKVAEQRITKAVCLFGALIRGRIANEREYM